MGVPIRRTKEHNGLEDVGAAGEKRQVNVEAGGLSEVH